MKTGLFALLILCGTDTLVCAAGQTGVSVPHTVVAATNRGVLVAQSGSVALYDRAATNVIWNSDGVQTPARIVTSNDQAAIIDSLHNEVRMIDLASGRATMLATGETPIDGAFVHRQFYLLERDARALERIGMDGARASIRLAADPAFLREASGRLYVYCRAAGVLQEITMNPFAIGRSVSVAPFASDLEIRDGIAYLVLPRAAKITTISLATMRAGADIAVVAVPVDIAFSSGMLAVADPSAKRVWMIEPRESFASTFARGFLRGLIGIGLTPAGNRDFPTGVDRVIVDRSRLYAYDSSTGTLYRSAKPIAKSITPQAFSVGPGGVYAWDDAVRRLQRLETDD